MNNFPNLWPIAAGAMLPNTLRADNLGATVAGFTLAVAIIWAFNCWSNK